MHAPYYLELVTGFGATGGVGPRVALTGVVRLGRAPDNDLVVADHTVSWHHATLSVERGGVRVRDVGSTNGTFLDDHPLDGEAAMGVGQLLRLGASATLRLGSTVPLVVPSVPGWRLEVIETAASLAIPVEGLRVGRGPAVDLSLLLADPATFLLRPCAGGAIVEPLGGLPFAVESGVPFALGGRSFRVLPTTGAPVRTEGARSVTDRYRLRVALDGAAGPQAVLFDPEDGRRHQVGADNRAVLLYLLAVKLIEDRAAQVPVPRRGWCTDAQLAIGIWGRDAARMEINNLHVLLHRLRRELADAGFDGGFLEKRSRALRARLVHVVRE